MLFGKDSSDRKDFEIKTLDQYNVDSKNWAWSCSSNLGWWCRDQHIKNTKKTGLKNVDPKLQSFLETLVLLDGVPMQQKPFKKSK
jgi:hypothetical protein